MLFMVSGVFYYFNSILNPILYTILSKRFRRGFSDISGKCWVYQVTQLSFSLNNNKPNFQKFAKAVSKRSKEESSLDQELAEFNLVIKVRGVSVSVSVSLHIGDQGGGEYNQLLWSACQALHVQRAEGEDPEKVTFGIFS